MPHDLPDYSIAPSFAVVLPTIYGDMIFHRGDVSQTQAHLKFGRSGDHREIELLARVLSYLPPDRCVVDVGANFGSFSLALSKVVGESGTVHAFEAQRVIFNMLAGTMALNSATNVRCYNMAVGDRLGAIEVPQFDYCGPPMSYGSIEFGPTQRQKLDQERGNNMDKLEHVALTTLDRYEFPRVDLLKIDVEGMEMQVLDGAVRTILRCRPVIFVEYWKVDPIVLAERLAGLGYGLTEIPGNYLAIPTEGTLPPVSALVRGLF